MKPDFKTMTKKELRAYVIAHPHDKEAFQQFVDRFTTEASSATFSLAQSQAEIQEIDHLIQKRVSNPPS
jgi:dephospho-CoA kinase